MECVGINPVRLASPERAAELNRIERRLTSSDVAGIKLYAGYYHYFVTDSIYGPIYELAKQYDVPVVIHTGDTYSMNGEKMLFGTDWPLAPIDLYIEFVKRLIPEKHFEEVFYRNAFQLFPRIGQRLNELHMNIDPEGETR